jgi:hypothetical protein
MSNLHFLRYPVCMYVCMYVHMYVCIISQRTPMRCHLARLTLHACIHAYICVTKMAPCLTPDPRVIDPQIADPQVSNHYSKCRLHGAVLVPWPRPDKLGLTKLIVINALHFSCARMNLSLCKPVLW